MQSTTKKNPSDVSFSRGTTIAASLSKIYLEDKKRSLELIFRHVGEEYEPDADN